MRNQIGTCDNVIGFDICAHLLCVRACVRACVRVCVCVLFGLSANFLLLTGTLLPHVVQRQWKSGEKAFSCIQRAL